MIYAQMWHEGTDGKPREMCGSDGVRLMDGRWSKQTCSNVAHGHGLVLNRNLGKRIVGFTLHSGENFSRSVEIQGYTVLREEKGK